MGYNDVLERVPQAPEPPAPAGSRFGGLALLYQEILTIIVRVQSGRQRIQDVEVFRKRISGSLNDIAREASKRDYTAEDLAEANFAIVAFINEAILNSADPNRTEWAKKPLQEELFEQPVAGELFFKRLQKLLGRRDALQLADLLEVYYLCLLLGYEGRYAVHGQKGELRLLLDELRERIERIRGRNPALSPDGRLPEEPAPAAATDVVAEKLRIVALGSFLVALLCFAASYIHLSLVVDEVVQSLTRGGTP